MKYFLKFFVLLYLTALLFCACSSQKFLQEGQAVLSSVKLKSDAKDFNPKYYKSFVRQDANSQWFNLAKVPLGVYNMSGRDSTKKLNRFFRRLGEAPVIYNPSQTQLSQQQITLAMQSQGYLGAYTTIDVENAKRGKKINLKYHLHPGTLYHISSIDRKVDDSEIDSLITMNDTDTKLSAGMACNSNILDEERDRIISILQNKGYYKVLKKYMYYDIDTIDGNQKLHLLLNFNGKDVAPSDYDYTRYWIGKIVVNVGDGDIDFNNVQCVDSVHYRDIWIRYFGQRKLRPNTIYSQLELHHGSIYSDQAVRTTYANLSRLQILQGSNIHFDDDNLGLLNCTINLRTKKTNFVNADLEGTNTSGDFGVAASVGFTNRNLFHGSEEWSTKIKGAFEAITGLEGYTDQNFFEISLESKLAFPRIIIPFLPEQKRIGLHGSSEISLQYNLQERPEFHRRGLTALWSYRWNDKRQKCQHKFDAIGINYVYMPWISQTFREQYLDNDNARFAIIRYSYENLFILNSAYNFIYNSAGRNNINSTSRERNTWQFHFGVESAGNFLYLLSKATQASMDNEGRYKLFNVAFAQYLKFDIDYARSVALNSSNSLAFRGALGIVQPYGNNSIVPYEKRYFAGGANSIRGWSVRELGPGSYKGEDGKVDFINQTGNVKVLFNLELRSQLFWKLSSALFVDAGNIWTTRNYEAQPGGQFRLDSFYKQIAAAYGIGLRFNFDYFILRFDMAMKAVNPSHANTHEHYPLLHPNLNRDFTLHFAVGLPF